jgi:transposase InsO family protein
VLPPKKNPNNKRLQVPGAQRQESYPGEDWQPDFTHMPGGPKSKLLLVFVDTFTGWVEAFPCSTERAREVVQVLITEIIPHFGLPKSIQSDNGPVFKAEVTQGLSRALGIEYHLHCAWCPQSSGKVEKTNELLKRHLAKLAQETHYP